MADQKHLRRPKLTEATIDLGEGDSITMSFDANKVTPGWMDETMKRVEAQDMLSLAKALSEVVLDWDVTDEGQPFPPTAQNIAVFSFPTINSLYETVCKSAAPSDAEGNASSTSSGNAPSLSTPAETSSRNGSDTSSLPAPSTVPS